MPLTPPAPRRHLHRRQLICDGYVREDGLWEIEGRIVDQRSYPFDNAWRGRVEPGDPLHEMWARLTLDDDFLIRAIEVATDNSPFAVCTEVAPKFQRLVGAKVGPGFARTLREAVRGREGCTHIVDMLLQMATVALQTRLPPEARAARDRILGRTPPPVADPARSPWADYAGEAPPPVLDTCHAWASDGAIVRRWLPRFYSGKD